MSPTCLASNPPSQRPYPAGGGSSKAARMRRSCSSWYCLGLPLRAASSRPDKPACAKRPRHLLSVAGRAPTRSATALLLSPSAMARITSARNAMPRSVFAAPSQPLKVARCSSINITSAALITAGYHLRQFTQLGARRASSRAVHQPDVPAIADERLDRLQCQYRSIPAQRGDGTAGDEHQREPDE